MAELVSVKSNTPIKGSERISAAKARCAVGFRKGQYGKRKIS
jgi:hypothetical protein